MEKSMKNRFLLLFEAIQVKLSKKAAQFVMSEEEGQYLFTKYFFVQNFNFKTLRVFSNDSLKIRVLIIVLLIPLKYLKVCL